MSILLNFDSPVPLISARLDLDIQARMRCVLWNNNPKELSKFRVSNAVRCESGYQGICVDDIALPPPSSNKCPPMTYEVPIKWCFVLACLFSGVREPWIQRNKKIYTEWVSAAGSLIWYAKINFQLTTSNRNEDDSTLKIFINNFVHLRKKINNSMSINYATDF